MQSGTAAFRLSPDQKHIWLLEQQDSSHAYVAQCAVATKGPVDPVSLKAALEQTVQRHEILRTTFDFVPGMKLPVQAVAGESRIRWCPDKEISGLAEDEQKRHISEWASQARAKAFDLQKGPLVDAFVVTLSPHSHVLIVTVPAFCSDGRGLENLVKDLAQCHGAAATGTVQDEPPQYVDVVELINEILEGEGAGKTPASGMDTWQESLSMELPLEHQRRVKPAFSPDLVSCRIEPELADRAEKAARQRGTDLEAFLLACWQTLIWRITGQTDVVVGVLYDARKDAGEEACLGLLSHYTPLRAHLDAGTPFSAVLKAAGSGPRNQFRFWWEESPKNSSSVEPFLPISFSFEALPNPISAGPVSFSIDDVYSCCDRFKLKLNCVRTHNSLTVELHYDSGLFARSNVEQLSAQYAQLVQSVVSNPDAEAGLPDIVTESERHRLVVEFNSGVQTPPAPYAAIHQLIEEAANKNPDAIAVRSGGRQLSYRELNSRADQVAHYLRKAGAGPEVPVGLFAERSLDLPVALLGILKSGAAYLPLVASYPKDRLKYMLDDSKAPMVLTQHSLLNSLPETNARPIPIDTLWNDISRAGAGTLPEAAADSLAYVIYTSGSTGRPKGVQVTHANLVHSTVARFRYYEKPVERFMLLSPVAFDSSVAGLFWTLCSGGTLVLPQEGVERDPSQIRELIAREKISHLLALPSLYARLLDEFKGADLESLKAIIVAGEPCTWDLVNRHRQHLPKASLFNEYGPTEGTVWSTVFDCAAESSRRLVPIGRPIPNAQTYILDAQRRPVPVGVAGEIYVGGGGVARGYLNQPELTAERFISDPFSKTPGARLYKTGDLGRYLPDGNIEFLGRIDHQVKVRGFRIELEEIEATLLLHPGIRESVVIAREDTPGDQRIVAYVVPANGLQSISGELRDFLQQRLPDYMIPSAFVPLTALPLTPNGKVDRRALPAPDGARPAMRTTFTAPVTKVERAVAHVWSELLGVEQVGIHDSFFELGGHSVLAAQLATRLREIFHVEVSLRKILESPTVAAISAAMARNPAEAAKLERVADVVIRLASMSEQDVEKMLENRSPNVVGRG